MQTIKLSKIYASKFLSLLLIVLIASLTFTGAVLAATYNATAIALTPGKNISELNFAWYTTSNTISLVQVALKSNMTGADFPVGSAISYYCVISPAASGYYSNKAVATSLAPNTEYVYRLGDANGNWTPVYYYTTRSVNQFNFLAVGDPQIGAGSISTDTTGWSNTVLKAVNQFPAAAFIMSAGDQVNTNNNESQFSGFFTPAGLRSLPVAPTLGNHDNGAENYGWHFNLPNLSTYGVTTPGSADYCYTYGNTLFIVLNTNNTSGPSHRTFIQNAVAANSGTTWRIVMFHHDIYGSGSHSTESSVLNLRAALYPIFDDYGIDIVITGHDHSYTRTYPMRGNVPQLNQTVDGNGAVINPTGTIYYTLNSASGSKYYDLNSTQESYVAVRSQIEAPTFSNIIIDGSSLSFKTYRADTMAQIDTYSIIKISGTPTPAPSASVTPTLTPARTQTPVPTVTPAGTGTFEKRVAAGMDDVEETVSTGSMYTNSSDLELSCDGSTNQVVGIRFNGVTIPKGATITKAYIQFTCDEKSTSATSLVINGQSADNAAAFSSSSHSVSSRSKTTASVSWMPSSWNTVGAAGANERTPDIKNIIQEIVNRSAWLSGNSMVIIVTGTSGSRRCAEAYEGSSSQAPLLHIEYTN